MMMLFLLLPPFAGEHPFMELFIILLYTLMIAVSILIITERDRLHFWHWLLILILILPWFRTDESLLGILADLILASFFSYMAIKIIVQILKSSEISLNIVIGSVSGYLMLGLGFSFICPLLMVLDPGAYSIPEVYKEPYAYIYYAFVTMSTLGYGDITPQNPQSQAVALLITIAGQFYMVIVVASLVGKYLAPK